MEPEMRPLFRLAVIALALSTAACVQHVDQDNNGWDVGSDSGEDAGTDTENDTTTDTEADTATDTGGDTEDGGDTGENYNVTFELVNNSGRPLYAAPAVFGANTCYGDSQPWLRVTQDGEYFGLADDSCIANCDTDDGPIACDLDCAIPTREQYRLGDGENRRYEWDATAWKIRDGCEVSESMVGETLTADFCYGAEFADDSARLLDQTCQTVEFTVDQPSQTVRVEIEPLEPNEVTFRMVNATGQDLYAHPGTPTQAYRCYGSWYTLGTGQRTLTPVSGCDGICTCEQVEQNPGEQCTTACPALAPCPAPTREALLFEAGTTLSDTWDGLVTFDDEVAGQTCRRRVPPMVDDLVATFCYARDIDEGNGYAQLQTPICTDIEFERATDEIVEFRIE
jgi:hypothetical protein